MNEQTINNYKSYLGNPLLKKRGVQVNWTPELVEEYMKCANDIIYFCEKYVKIINVDVGLMNFNPYDYQRVMLKTMTDSRYTIIGTARQAGKCIFINTTVDVRINGQIEKITVGELYELSKKLRNERMCTLSDTVSSEEKKYALVLSRSSKHLERYSEKHKEIPEQRRESRLCSLRDMWLSSCSPIWPPFETSNDYSRISTKVSETNCLPELLKKSIRDRFWREQPSFQSSRSLISVFKELQVSGSLRPVYPSSESESDDEKEQQSVNNKGVLSKEGLISGRVGITSKKTPKDIYTAKVYRNTRRDDRNGYLEKPPGELAKYHEVQASRRNIQDQQDEDGWRQNFERRKKTDLYLRRIWNGARDAVYPTNKRHERYKGWKQVDRIQRGLLALQSEDISSRVYQQDYKHDCKADMGERREEESFSHREWIRDDDHLGVGLQDRFRESYSGVSLLSNRTFRKFIDVVPVTNIEILTDSGYRPISSVNKTIPYQRWIIRTETGKELICADTHILFNECMEEIYAMDLVPFMTSIATADGVETVTHVECTDKFDNMFDISVDHDNHRYYTNDILSHNSTTTCAFILHYILFNETKTVALLANKGDTAREILGRIQLAYQHLPKWLQQGVVEWNKGSFELENGSRVIASATSSNNIRGYSINLLFIDEAAFIENWDTFFTSVYPTISSGKDTKIILVSTPNGLNHFYQIWQNASEKRNNYNAIKVVWQDVPGRDDNWRRDTLSAMNFDTEKFEQEYCITGDMNVTIKKENGEIIELSIEDLYFWLS